VPGRVKLNGNLVVGVLEKLLYAVSPEIEVVSKNHLSGLITASSFPLFIYSVAASA